MSNSQPQAPDAISTSGFAKLAILTNLVRRAPVTLGRTGLMKCVFFLKTLRNVPLPYSFRLYTYGPFDSHVLDDLQYAESLGAIKSTMIHYSGGYQYQLQAGSEAERVEGRAKTFITKHQDDVDWVLNSFGRRSAAELEMASTLVYTDRALGEKGQRVSITELVNRVREVKPHLAADIVEREVKSLGQEGLLIAVS